MDATIGQNAATIAGRSPSERTAALADARRQATQTALASAEQAEVRRADAREQVRSLLEQAVGANTRLQVTRSIDDSTFIYRALHEATGGVELEWPPAQVARFLAENGGQVDPELVAGAFLDEQA